MNKKFLYKKTYPIGFMDYNEVEDLDSWFLDDSREILREKIRNENFESIIIELIDTFRGGKPNYIELSLLFGFENSEEINQGEITQVSFYEIHRNDIDKIEVDIKNLSSEDKQLIISKLYLYVNKLLSIDKIINEIDKVYDDLSYEKSEEGLIIHEGNSDIIIELA